METNLRITQEKPELNNQTEYRWSTEYDSHLRYSFYLESAGEPIAVSALLTPRFYLAEHLKKLALLPSAFYEIGALYVAPQFRRSGIASQLITIQHHFLAKTRMRPVCCVMEENVRSQELFLSLGYEFRGEFEGVDGTNLVFLPPS